MNLYNAVVETLILLAVIAEAWISWKNLQERQRTRVRRAFGRLIKRIGVNV